MNELLQFTTIVQIGITAGAAGAGAFVAARAERHHIRADLNRLSKVLDLLEKRVRHIEVETGIF